MADVRAQEGGSARTLTRLSLLASLTVLTSAGIARMTPTTMAHLNSVGIRQASTTPGSATSTPQPTPSATVSPSLTPSTTPTVTTSPTASPTPTIVSLISTPTALTMPTSLRGAAAANLTADLVGLLGGTDKDPLFAMDADRIAIVLDDRLWIVSNDAGPTRTLGHLALRRSRDHIRDIGMYGDTVAMIEGERALFVDISQANNVELRTEISLPVRPRYIAHARDRVYMASGGFNLQEVVISAFELSAPGVARLLWHQRPEAERLHGLFAGDGVLATIPMTNAEDATSIHWQLLATTQGQEPAPILRGPPGSSLADIRGDRMLLSWESGLSLYDLGGLPGLLEVGRWMSNEPDLAWARIHGNELSTGHWIRDDDRVVGRRLSRLVADESGDYAVAEERELPSSGRYKAEGGAYCREQGHFLDCLDRSWRNNSVSLAELAPDGERRLAFSCQSAAALGSERLVACEGEVLTLEQGSDWRLWAGPTVASGLGHVQFIDWSSRLFAHTSGRGLVEFERQGDGWGMIESGIFGQQILVEDGLIIAALGRSPTRISVHDANDLQLLSEWQEYGVNLNLRPQMVDRVLHLRFTDGGWLRFDLADASAPAEIAVLQDFAPRGFLASGDVAYVAVNGERLETYDMNGDIPMLLNTVDLSNDVPTRYRYDQGELLRVGERLVWDRGAGWMSRLDARDPRQPQPLAPQAFAGSSLSFYAMADDLAVIVDGRSLELLSASAEAVSEPRTTWAPWYFSQRQRITVAGRRLFIRMSNGGSDPAADHWAYDLRDPDRPMRDSRVPEIDGRWLMQGGDQLYTLAKNGYEVRAYRADAGANLVLQGKWCFPDGRCNASQSATPARGLAQREGILYTTDASGLVTELDASDPRRIRHLAGWRFEGFDSGTPTVVGDSLWLNDTSNPPYLVDIRTPGRLVPIGPMQGLPGRVIDIVALGANAAVLVLEEELVLVDVSNTADVTVLSRLHLGESVYAASVDASRILVSISGGGLLVVDAANRRAPRVVGRLPLGVPGSIASLDGVVYFAHGERASVEVLTNLRPLLLEPGVWLPLLSQRRASLR